MKNSIFKRKYNFIRVPIEDVALPDLINYVINNHKNVLDRYLSVNVQVPSFKDFYKVTKSGLR